MNLPIYMDDHATTPIDLRVLDAMLPYLTERFGNASSHHSFGEAAAAAVDVARAQVAALIGATPDEIVFTSGATESDNLAIKGIAEALAPGGGRIITAPTEHPAVLDTCEYLAQRGYETVFLPVDRDGIIDPDDLRKVITDDTVLVSVMQANNEIGVIQPIADLAKIAGERGVPFHSDAVQSVGKISVDVNRLGLGLMSITAHKLYGPKGIGALYVRNSLSPVLARQIHGGGQERGLRSGTLNVPGIVGFGAACEIARLELPEESVRVAALRGRLYAGLREGLDEIHLNGHPVHRLPGNLNVSFFGVQSDALLAGLPEIAISAGSACASGSLHVSHVLQAIGVPDVLAHSAIRFGLGRFTTADQVEYTIGRVVETVGRLRRISPLWEGR